ncbi:hypothetical protein Rhopal_007713-T1 [Rhodotorula paludigena]|uniref:Pre-mRNA-splicing factor SYF1 n=1 Tax=Rhodotorula paludigena TaxID=86838 RepID=A0AAV5GXC7_9BASI|nr:hypothetical protein Rhopal_007713-T1 [Rhodotorula paludigena]
MVAYSELAALLPLTVPTPTFVSHPTLLRPEHLSTEHDLLRNPDSLERWQAYIRTIHDEVDAALRDSRGQASGVERILLGDRLSTEQGRVALQRLVDVYERALQHHPRSYSLWRDYLAARAAFVLGKPNKPLKLGAPRKRRGEDGVGRTMLEWLEAGKGEVDEIEEGERDYEAEWEGALDGVLGFEEWRSLAATYERALMWLPQMPRLWLSYLTLFVHPSCPAALSHTHARRTFDRAIRTLPPSLHERVWHLYLSWASPSSPANPAPETIVHVWRRYLSRDPSPTSFYIHSILLALDPPRPLEAAKRLLSLARQVQKGEYKHPTGAAGEVKSAYQILVDWLEVCEKYPEEVGIEADESRALRTAHDKAKLAAEAAAAEANGDDGVAGAAKKKPAASELPDLDPSVLDPTSLAHLDVDGLVRSHGLEQYPDQAGRLWTGLATYWIKRGEFGLARETFEEALGAVVTLRDFTQVFDSYAEFEESYISGLMEAVADADEDDEDKKDDEAELDERMKSFEDLMDRRPFLVNEVLLRRNPNDVQEWEKRVAETYTLATKTINPRKSVGPYNLLWVHFAKFYEQGGVAQEGERDVPNARKIFEKATKVPFRRVDELAEVWCEWAEMEVRNENYDEAIKVMQRATAIPKNWRNISFHDESLAPQQRLFKSLKLWSFFVDLEESIGTVETTKSAYDKIFELKIANAQVVINYANFLEENEYWEESFKVYERGVDLFTYPIAFEIWNAYLSKFVKRYGGSKLERARDLFEQALETCPPKYCKPIFLLYGQLEEEHGLAKRAMAVYDRATRAVEPKDRMEIFTYYIARATSSFGLPATRPIYERAIEQLPDAQTAEMCLRFAALERKLGEIDRARAVYAHASQFCDPRTNPDFWAQWNAFEIETGSEDTFREYLRIKRAVQAAFNTESSYLSAKLAQMQKGGQAAREAVQGGDDVDPMAALDRATGGGTAVRGFVAASNGEMVGGQAGAARQDEPAQENADEIAVDDDDDD